MFGSTLLMVLGPYAVIGLLFIWAVAGLACLRSPKKSEVNKH